MTIYRTGLLVYQYYYKRLNFYEKNVLVDIMGGVTGLGDPTDEVLKDYLSDRQMAFIKKLGKKFRIK